MSKIRNKTAFIVVNGGGHAEYNTISHDPKWAKIAYMEMVNSDFSRKYQGLFVDKTNHMAPIRQWRDMRQEGCRVAKIRIKEID